MSGIRGASWPLIAILLAAAILAAPLWCVAMPAMPDYPAHLASFYLIGGGPSAYYTVAWDFLPNLASEALVPLAAKLLPLGTAARVFLTLTVFFWVLGPAAIQYALFGRVSFGALFAALFAYNANFQWGFFNYTFATGLSFLAFAAWIATDRRRTPTHSLGFALAFTAIYFAHLFALAVLLLAIAGFEISGWRQNQERRVASLFRRAGNVALLCLPAAAAFLFLKPPGTNSGNLEFDLLDTFADRFEAAIQYGFDKPATILTVLLIAALAAALVTRRAAVHPRLAILLAALAVITLTAPQWALGGWGVHLRLPAVRGALTFASVEWRLSPRLSMAFAGVALALLTAGAAALGTGWQTYDGQFAEFRAHASDVRQGARLMIVLDGDSLGMASDQPYWLMAEWMVIDRGGFTPLMFTTAGQHVIHIRPPLAHFAAATAQQGSPPDIDELDDLAHARLEIDPDYRDVFPYLSYFQCHFDQAVVIHGAGRHARVPAMLRQRHEGTFYTLYDIVGDGSCKTR